MPVSRVRYRVESDRVATCLGELRNEMRIPDGFPAAVQAEAERAAAAGPRALGPREDHTGLDLVTIDPPDSLDLDQAYAAERRGAGVRIWYAIADVAAFVTPGGTVDLESAERGVTLYAPDRRASLHPEVLSEGSASLLPEGERPALLWRLDLDADGILEEAEVVRATVQVRAKMAYGEVQHQIDSRTSGASLSLLRDIGRMRLEIEADRGGVSLNLPTQEIIAVGDGFELRYDEPIPVERWNAQVSLLAGMAAAELMVDAGVGILRTLPPPRTEVLTGLRASARSLRISWDDDECYADAVRHLHPDDPSHAAFLTLAVRALRGAGYITFDGETPGQHEHSAIAAPYAHVTAPLRRIVDRYAGEIALSICGSRRPPDWVIAGMPALPSIMGRARSRESTLERNVLDLTEALVLEDQVGRRFGAVLTAVDDDGRGTILLREPAVVADLDDPGDTEPGHEVSVVLTEADPEQRIVRFTI